MTDQRSPSRSSAEDHSATVQTADNESFTPCPQPSCTGILDSGSCTAECVPSQSERSSAAATPPSEPLPIYKHPAECDCNLCRWAKTPPPSREDLMVLLPKVICVLRGRGWTVEPPVPASAPPSAMLPCVNCGEPVSESANYSWLHVGGWRDCDLVVPRPVATPPDDVRVYPLCVCTHYAGQHDDGGCMFPKWHNTGGTTCGCAAYDASQNAPEGRP